MKQNFKDLLESIIMRFTKEEVSIVKLETDQGMLEGHALYLEHKLGYFYVRA